MSTPPGSAALIEGGAAAPAAPGFWRLNGINSFWFASSGTWNSIYLLLATSAALLAPGGKELVV